MMNRILAAACFAAFGAVGVWLLADRKQETPPAADDFTSPNSPARPSFRERLSEQKLSSPAVTAQVPRTEATPNEVPALPAPPGIHFVPLDQQQLPEEVKQEILSELKRLRETGSTSGGKRTHEFAHTDYFARQLQNKGWHQLVSELGIIPSPLSAALGPDWRLIGADVLSKQVSGLGWSGFAQVFQSGQGHGLVELSETQYDVLAGDGAVISPEVFNGKVGEHPAMVERVVDEDGAELFTYTWFVRHRRFSLSSKHLPQEQVVWVAQRLSNAHLAMPHEGWKQAYEFDENNALHRYAKLRTQQRMPPVAPAR